MSKTELDRRLTHREADLWRRFQAHLNLKNKSLFSSDDLIAYFEETDKKLEEYFSDTQHGIGVFFFKLICSGEIRKATETYGRYNRRIWVYTFNEA